MSFGFTNLRAWFFTGLMLGVLPLALGQSAEPGQQIIFSSPDGQIVSNALPATLQATQPQQPANVPETPVPADIFKSFDPTPPPHPTAIWVSDRKPQDAEDNQNPLKHVTPAQIMGVQTIEQIFGLPERDGTGAMTNSSSDENQNTNYIYSGDSSSGDSQWTKLLSDNLGGNTSGSNTTRNSRSTLGGFWDAAPRRSFFDNHDKSAGETGFNSSPAGGPVAQSLGWDSFQQPAATPDAADSQPVSSLNSTFSPGLNSQSAFALPKSSPEALPQLPSLPGSSSQNYNAPRPVTPSWEPKPPPWLSPVPQPGTLQDRKF